MKHWCGTGRVNRTDCGTIWAPGASTVSLTIPGVLVSMKNDREIVVHPRTGKKMVIKGAAARAYLADFALFCPDSKRLGLGSMTQLLRLIATAWYPSWRSDLDVELLKDCLQAYGVVKNDRWIREEHLYAEVDAGNPRVELIVELI